MRNKVGQFVCFEHCQDLGALNRTASLELLKSTFRQFEMPSDFGKVLENCYAIKLDDALARRKRTKSKVYFPFVVNATFTCVSPDIRIDRPLIRTVRIERASSSTYAEFFIRVSLSRANIREIVQNASRIKANARPYAIPLYLPLIRLRNFFFTRHSPKDHARPLNRRVIR